MPGIEAVQADNAILHLRLCNEPRGIIPAVVRRLVESGAGVLQVVADSRDLRSLYRSIVDAPKQEVPA